MGKLQLETNKAMQRIIDVDKFIFIYFLLNVFQHYNVNDIFYLFNSIYNSSQIELNNVEIYSLLGKKLKEYNSNTTIYNIEDLSSGLYLVKIYSKKGMSTLKKVIKE